MGKAEREQKRLNAALTLHLSNIHETFQALNRTPASSLDRVSWDEVVKMGDQVSKQATMAGMLWSGNKPEMKVLVESMEAYFNTLQGLVLYSHTSSVGAGPTLLSSIHASIKQVVDASFMLWRESVSSYEQNDTFNFLHLFLELQKDAALHSFESLVSISRDGGLTLPKPLFALGVNPHVMTNNPLIVPLGSSNKEKGLTIPQLVGTVWETCSALKKTPSSNITAIGRAMTQVAISMKDVLREMQDLKPPSSDAEESSPKDPSNQLQGGENDDALSDVNDLGNDLSPEEMKMAQTATLFISETLMVVKELIRSITGFLERENLKESSDEVGSLEKLLKLCQDTGVQIDELGACLYPPQELASIVSTSDTISSIVGEMQQELVEINGSTESFSQACNALKEALAVLRSEVKLRAAEEEGGDAGKLVPEIQNLTVGS